MKLGMKRNKPSFETMDSALRVDEFDANGKLIKTTDLNQRCADINAGKIHIFIMSFT